jgi:hypothetical protein
MEVLRDLLKLFSTPFEVFAESHWLGPLRRGGAGEVEWTSLCYRRAGTVAVRCGTLAVESVSGEQAGVEAEPDARRWLGALSGSACPTPVGAVVGRHEHDSLLRLPIPAARGHEPKLCLGLQEVGIRPGG